MRSKGSETMRKYLLVILIILFVAPLLGGCYPYWYGYYGNRDYYGYGYDPYYDGPYYYSPRYYGPYYYRPYYTYPRGYR